MGVGGRVPARSQSRRFWSRFAHAAGGQRRRVYRLDFDRPKSVGKIHGYFGSFLCILRSYVYILYYGRERLAQIAENAVLNANYIRVQLTEPFRCGL